jgi:hypothetical protein
MSRALASDDQNKSQPKRHEAACRSHTRAAGATLSSKRTLLQLSSALILNIFPRICAPRARRVFLNPALKLRRSRKKYISWSNQY